jgi:hypothetical protein
MSVSTLIPVNLTPAAASSNGDFKIADTGMLMTATVRIMSSAFEAFANVDEPSKQRHVQSTKAAVWSP